MPFASINSTNPRTNPGNLRELRENFKLKIRTLVDNFAKPVMCLLLDVIQWFMENGIDYEPESIYSDVRVRNCIFVYP